MGFFAAVVFLPRWFQFVLGTSAHRVRLPDPAAAGGPDRRRPSSSGQIVARTGRYKALIVGALLLMAVGLFLLTNLRAETPIRRSGCGWRSPGSASGPPSRSSPSSVQNAVPVRELGTATSSLTLFQQVGGTIGLAIAGTLFGSVLLEEIPKQMTAPASRRRASRASSSRRQLLHQPADERGRRPGRNDPVPGAGAVPRQPSSHSSAPWWPGSTRRSRWRRRRLRGRHRHGAAGCGWWCWCSCRRAESASR